MIGQTISHYKILEKLGEGGMGVVYRAHDTELDRDVALKFLPQYLTGDPKEKERFYREARAASALSHPNITTIHEIKEFDNKIYLAMELVEGRTLKDVLEGEPLSVLKVLDIAIQVCEGLAAAHERNIVHRDIKSANIMLTAKGQVKIMDFGLAKVAGATKLTQSGSTLGTAAYMSPEQARGEEVDQRSDIFSFGVVLYELLTGRLPFRGEHQAALMYSIVNEEPPLIARFNQDVPPEIEQIVAKSMTKEREERYQHVDDLLADLRRVRKRLEYASAGYAPATGGTPVRVPISAVKKIVAGRHAIVFTGLGVFLVICAAAALIYFPGRSKGVNPDWTQHPLHIQLKDISIPGISGDGNWIAFEARENESRRGLYSMNTKRGEPRIVFPCQEQMFSFVDMSNDGSLILFNRYNYRTDRMDCYVVPTNGGAPQNIVQGGCAGPRFRPDGQRVGYILGWQPWANPSPSGKLEFWSVGFDGVPPQREFVDSVSRIDGSVSFSYSPDGNKIAWLRTYPESYEEIIIHDLQSGQEKKITSDKKTVWEVTWAGEDRIAYTTDIGGIFNVWVVSAEGGRPVQITKGVDRAMGIKSSANGQKILYVQERQVTDLWLVGLRENRPRQITFTEEYQSTASFSPDGRSIAFVVGSDLLVMPSHLFVMNRDGTNRRQLTFGDELVGRAFWSLDGRWIAYGSRKLEEPEDSMRTYIIEVANPGSPRYICRGTASLWLDSTRLQVRVKNTMYLTSIDGAAPTPVYDDSTRAVLILGGKYIIFHDLHQGKDIGVYIVDATKPRDEQRKTGHLLPWHSHNILLPGDTKTLFSLRGKEVWRMALPDGREERVTGDFLGVDDFYDLIPNRDGKEFIVIKHRSMSNIVMIENLFR
jgi:serine/threonine protein kinase